MKNLAKKNFNQTIQQRFCISNGKKQHSAVTNFNLF